MENIHIYIDYIAKIIEAVGVITILVGSVYALAKYLIRFKSRSEEAYIAVRQEVGKAILLGLEMLIAADIVATVVTQPSLKSVAVLGLIVLIRTFLSLSIQVELEGKFPWQNNKP